MLYVIKKQLPGKTHQYAGFVGGLKCCSPLRKVAVLNGGGLISVYALSLGTADFISM